MPNDTDNLAIRLIDVKSYLVIDTYIIIMKAFTFY